MSEVAKKENARLLFLDVAKIIGVTLMVFAHARERGVEILYIYGFHMPLFFVINGFSFRIKENESAGDFLIRKIKGYIIPFIILSILLIFTDMALDASKGSAIDWNYFVNKLVYVYQNPRPYPLWFVLALFFADIWLYIFIRLSFKKNYLVLLYSLISLVLILIFYRYTPQKLAHSFDVSFVGVFFVTLGYLFYNWLPKKMRDYILNRRLISLLVGGVLFASYILIIYALYVKDPSSREMLDMWGNYYKPYYIRIPTAILGSFGLILLCNVISNKPLAYLGRHTLVVLAFQQNLTIRIFKEYVAKDWYNALAPLKENNMGAVWYSVVCTIFSLAILIPLSVILFETHVSYIFMKRPAKWYLNLIYKIKRKDCLR